MEVQENCCCSCQKEPIASEQPEMETRQEESAEEQQPSNPMETTTEPAAQVEGSDSESTTSEVLTADEAQVPLPIQECQLACDQSCRKMRCEFKKCWGKRMKRCKAHRLGHMGHKHKHMGHMKNRRCHDHGCFKNYGSPGCHGHHEHMGLHKKHEHHGNQKHHEHHGCHEPHRHNDQDDHHGQCDQDGSHGHHGQHGGHGPHRHHGPHDHHGPRGHNGSNSRHRHLCCKGSYGFRVYPRCSVQCC